MNKFFKMFGAAGFLAVFLILGGCGSDSAPTVAAKATPVTAAVAVNGVATTTAAASPTTAGGTTVMTIPSGTTITSSAVGGFTAAPVVTVSTLTSGTAAITPAKVGTTTFSVSSTAGAVDITFNTTGNVTLGTPVAVTIPVTTTPASPITVISIKADGTTQTYNNGVYTATSGTTGPGVVTVPGVTDFCWFAVNPVFLSPTGSTGSASTFQIR